MIASMLALNPDHRPTFEKILSDHRNTIFPDYFYTFLGDYAINLAADHHVPENNTTNDPIAKGFGQADFIILGICRDWDGIIAAMMEEHDLSVNREQDRGAEDNNEEVNHEDISEL
jgi:phosphoinositide-3-kinase regulatory subunit 4